MATDFVQHSAEIKQAAHLVVGTTKTQVSHTTAHFHKPPDLLQVINSSSQTLARLSFHPQFSRRWRVGKRTTTVPPERPKQESKISSTTMDAAARRETRYNHGLSQQRTCPCVSTT